MIERMLWHPVALISDISNSPLGVVLLDESVVLWRDTLCNIHAWADKCPHRGAMLSKGKVQKNEILGAQVSTLECPYHGWQFGDGGLCRLVPASPTFVPPASHCVKTYAVQEAYGLVWVQLDTARTALPLPGPEQEKSFRRVHCGPYDVATSGPRVVENFLDMAHFGFVHEGYLGARDTTAIAEYTVERTANGIRATGCYAWQPQANVQAVAGAQVSYTYEVVSPYCAVLTKVPEIIATGDAALDNKINPSKPPEGKEYIALWVCPVSAEKSRVWFTYVLADFESTDQALREFQNTIFMQDKPILESQKPACLPLDLRMELHTAADKTSASYRKYLRDGGITFGVC
jgi:phenylpropionate dioxygenase-like ring-hydroxylating dioxygenase large terminal subunit